ncbi:helix-turn-helix domain-containing protein [Aquimarina longa]|uniref:helix-turn-helix domain-containing protein n=1 Tax=Aquimarina longa TaxID=1080221 RepID=UPI000785053C|nr:helix-turn-helix domain-containing protein [Aquimarina longa]
MDVVTIERKTFEKMMTILQELQAQTQQITEPYKRLLLHKEWLDNQDVCLLLRIDKRTLQNYKNKGVLGYSKINRKNYFKASEVKKLLKTTAENGTTHNNF